MFSVTQRDPMLDLLHSPGAPDWPDLPNEPFRASEWPRTRGRDHRLAAVVDISRARCHPPGGRSLG